MRFKKRVNETFGEAREQPWRVVVLVEIESLKFGESMEVIIGVMGQSLAADTGHMSFCGDCVLSCEVRDMVRFFKVTRVKFVF